MVVYDELKRQAFMMSVEEFARRFAGLYLLGSIRELRAARANAKTRQMLPALGPGGAPMEQLTEERPVVWRVAKSDRNDDPGRISVGRATINDVIIRHHQVSKRHAYFTVEGGAPGDPGTSLTIYDAGSVNGTRVNGMALGREESSAVRVGDQVSFGGMACHVWDAPELYGVLRSS